MATHTLKEVSVPYTGNAEDDAIGHDTIMIRRNGEPIAVVIPFSLPICSITPRRKPSRVVNR